MLGQFTMHVNKAGTCCYSKQIRLAMFSKTTPSWTRRWSPSHLWPLILINCYLLQG